MSYKRLQRPILLVIQLRHDTILTFIGNELPDHHYTQLNESSQRAFQVRLPAKPQMSDRLYFLLVGTETEDILACGYVKPIHPVICNQETFSFLNIGGIIANDKGGKLTEGWTDFARKGENLI